MPKAIGSVWTGEPTASVVGAMRNSRSVGCWKFVEEKASLEDGRQRDVKSNFQMLPSTYSVSDLPSQAQSPDLAAAS